MWINLTSCETLIRYISEWDPREVAHTKGGYLEGSIQVPEHRGKLNMVIMTHPAEDVDPLIAEVHPVLLHCVRIGKGKRDQYLEPVPTYYHWQQLFEIENGNVSIINRTSELDVEEDGRPRNVPKIDVVTIMNDDNIINLGRRRGDLNLVLLQPKQKTRAKEEEATVTKVLMDRLRNNDPDLIAEYEKLYKGKNIKNMKKVRIRVVFFCESFQCEAVSPQCIIDTGNKEIGAMDLVDCIPRKSCVNGKRKIIIVSEYILSRDVAPIFQVFRREGETWSQAPEYERLLIQPSNPDSKVEVKKLQIIFDSPPQPNLRLIPEDCEIWVAVKRKGDGQVTDKKFQFFYLPCWPDQCMFCDFGRPYNQNF